MQFHSHGDGDMIPFYNCFFFYEKIFLRIDFEREIFESDINKLCNIHIRILKNNSVVINLPLSYLIIIETIKEVNIFPGVGIFEICILDLDNWTQPSIC